MAERASSGGGGAGSPSRRRTPARPGSCWHLAVAPLGRSATCRCSPAGELSPRRPRALAQRRPGRAASRPLRSKGQPGLRRGLRGRGRRRPCGLVIGPPGAGSRWRRGGFPRSCRHWSSREAIEVTKIASIAGRPCADGTLARDRFRAPHHTISAAGLVGGGGPPRPGEITLAHRGVLFLDELGEFSRASLEALRQPLEDGTVTISRAAGRIDLPGALPALRRRQPRPCGHGEGSSRCRLQCRAGPRVRGAAERCAGRSRRHRPRGRAAVGGSARRRSGGVVRGRVRPGPRRPGSAAGTAR